MQHSVQISSSFLECKNCNTTARAEFATAAAALKSVMNSLPPSSESQHRSSLKWPNIIGFSGVQSYAPASSYQSPLIQGQTKHIEMLEEWELWAEHVQVCPVRCQDAAHNWLSVELSRTQVWSPREDFISSSNCCKTYLTFANVLCLFHGLILLRLIYIF